MPLRALETHKEAEAKGGRRAASMNSLNARLIVSSELSSGRSIWLLGLAGVYATGGIAKARAVGTMMTAMPMTLG